MIERPSDLGPSAYPGDDLRRYRFHTGAPLRPLSPGEPCPVLFRDLGLVALERFLRGDLPRLAGPLTPLLYMRVASFSEPYVDHEQTGRLVFLRPLLLSPWHAGVPGVMVALASRHADPSTVGFAPGGLDLAEVEARAARVRTAAELREELGGRLHDRAVADERARLRALSDELRATERMAEPVRRALQSGPPELRRRVREALRERGVSEDDLCAAFNHVPRDRRARLAAELPGIVRCLPASDQVGGERRR